MAKPITPALRALLATTQYWKADCYTFTLTSGTVLRYTTGDRDITIAGNVFSSALPFDRSIGSWKIGVEVSSMTLVCGPAATDLVDGVTFKSAARLGQFDGADVQVERAYMPTYGDVSAGTVIIHIGRVGDVEVDGLLVSFTINSHMELLAQKFPRNIYQPGCVWTLYDQGCGLSKAAFTFSRALLAGSTLSILKITDAHAVGYYDLGTIKFTSGGNNKVSRTVKSWDGTNVVLFVPLPRPVTIGDALDCSAGCDLQQATCGTKFANLPNFRAFPYLPIAETAV